MADFDAPETRAMQILPDDEPGGEEFLVDGGDGETLEGLLSVPEAASSVVLFAHATGAARDDAADRSVALTLRSGGLATLLLDLVPVGEEGMSVRGDRERAGGEERFDVDRLVRRLRGAARWLAGREDTRGLPLAIYGVGIGGAAALRLAAEEPELVKGLALRGGRLEPAADAAAGVAAPTLLVVGEHDAVVRRESENVLARLRGTRELAVVAGAGHAFAEPGTLDEMAVRVRDWFLLWVSPALHPAP